MAISRGLYRHRLRIRSQRDGQQQQRHNSQHGSAPSPQQRHALNQQQQQQQQQQHHHSDIASSAAQRTTDRGRSDDHRRAVDDYSNGLQSPPAEANEELMQPTMTCKVLVVGNAKCGKTRYVIISLYKLALLRQMHYICLQVTVASFCRAITKQN
jgi:hypothetical protein